MEDLIGEKVEILKAESSLDLVWEENIKDQMGNGRALVFLWWMK